MMNRILTENCNFEKRIISLILFENFEKFRGDFRGDFIFRLFEMTLKQTTSLFAIKVILNSVNTFLIILAKIHHLDILETHFFIKNFMRSVEKAQKL